MTKTAVAAAPLDPAEEPCYCTHERKWHDACSLCKCPWFLSPANEGARRRWRADHRIRTLAMERA